MSNKGWECPKCENVYAPSVKKCKKCTAKKTSWDDEGKINWASDQGDVKEEAPKGEQFLQEIGLK